MSVVDEVIVLAGGLGTRLRPLVHDVPKPLALVSGKPFLEWVLQGLADQGMRRCILATGYMADKIQARLGPTFLDMEMVYSVEAEPLGTGGAIALAARHLSGTAAHVVNGDTFLRYSPHGLEQIAKRHNAIGIALARVDDVSRYGAVQLDGEHVRGFSEKGKTGGGWINAGCYFLDQSALDAMPDGKFSFEEHILQPYAAAGRVVAVTETSGFIDIGIPEDYLRAQQRFGAGM